MLFSVVTKPINISLPDQERCPLPHLSPILRPSFPHTSASFCMRQLLSASIFPAFALSTTQSAEDPFLHGSK